MSRVELLGLGNERASRVEGGGGRAAGATLLSDERGVELALFARFHCTVTAGSRVYCMSYDRRK